jgi:hypothetical protein
VVPYIDMAEYSRIPCGTLYRHGQVPGIPAIPMVSYIDMANNSTDTLYYLIDIPEFSRNSLLYLV